VRFSKVAISFSKSAYIIAPAFSQAAARPLE
jgi:hypothetical protein